MKCSPKNIVKILAAGDHSPDDQYLLNLDEEYMSYARKLALIKNKKHKLVFLLHAFNSIDTAIDDGGMDFEVDSAKINDWIRNEDWWLESYDTLFDEDEEKFWDNWQDSDVGDGEIIDFVMENIEIPEVICADIDTETISKEDFIKNINDIIYVSEALNYLKSVNQEYNFEIFFRDKTVFRGKSDFYCDDASDYADELVKDIIEAYVACLYKIKRRHYDDNLPELIRNNFNDRVRKYWLDNNKEDFANSEVNSQIDNNRSEFNYAMKKIADKYLGARTAPEGVRHYVRPGIEDELSRTGWIKSTEDKKIYIDDTNSISGLGADDWVNMIDEIGESIDQYAIKGDGVETLEEIKRRALLIKNIIDSDNALKNVFTDETRSYQISDDDIENIPVLVDSISEDMPYEYGQKLRNEFIGSAHGDLLEAAQRRREIKEKLEKERKEQLLKLEQERNAAEAEKMKYIENPELLKKDFDKEHIDKAKSQDIIPKPFPHKSVMKIDSEYPGSFPFKGKEMPSSVVAHPFLIAIHPKKMQSDPSGMDDVFHHEIGLNYHGRSFSKLPDNDVYDVLGWIGGRIDFSNKIMYVEEIQSDIMQNTPRMKNVNSSKATIEGEIKKIKNEIAVLQKDVSVPVEEFYSKKLDQLKLKLSQLGPGEYQVRNDLMKAISIIENKSRNKENPYVKQKQKIRDLDEKLEELQEQLSNIENEQRNSNLNRPHLSGFKSKIENRFESWVESFYNSIFKYCDNMGMNKLYIVSAGYLKSIWKQHMGEQTSYLYKRLYDKQAQKYGMEKINFKDQTWWYMDFKNKKPKYAHSWYKILKFADTDFSSININDLIERFVSGEIDKSELEKLIRERYNQSMSNMSKDNPKIFLTSLQAFFEHFLASIMEEGASLQELDDYARIEKIKEVISNYMNTTGKQYIGDDGDLKEPFHSLMHRFLIQKYDYDMDLEELVD